MRNKAVIKALIKATTTFVVLLAFVFGYFAKSLGWFAKNDTVKAGGALVSVDGVSVEITQINSANGEVNEDALSVSFSQLYPGKTVSVIIEVTCYKEVPSLTVSLVAPQNCETPVKSDNKNFYLGSQIILSSLSYNGAPLEVDAVGKSLFSATPEEDWGITKEKTPTDIEIHTISPLAVGKHEFIFQFTFYNAPYNQNVLKNFGEICYREFQIK